MSFIITRTHSTRAVHLTLGSFAAHSKTSSCHNWHCHLWLRYLKARSRIVRWKYGVTGDQAIHYRPHDNLNMRPRASWATFLAFSTRTLHTTIIFTFKFGPILNINPPHCLFMRDTRATALSAGAQGSRWYTWSQLSPFPTWASRHPLQQSCRWQADI